MNIQKIAVISYHTCPLSDEKDIEIGGMNVYVLELSKELSKKGLSVDIYTRQVEINNPQIVQINQNLRVIHLPAGKVEKVAKNKLINLIPNFLENFYNFIKKAHLSYDLISCHYYLSGLIGLDISSKYKIPLSITFHTLALMKNLVARNEEEKADFKRIEMEILLVQEAAKVIATSNKDAEYIHTLYNCPLKKISILTPGVNHELFKPTDKKLAKRMVNISIHTKLILFVGRIEPLKGIDVLLYALRILLKNNPELKLRLWIIGGDNIKDKANLSKELNRLKQIKKILNITAFVQFLGRKKQEELPNYYNASEIVIMPSQYESFGITALEAISCAVPVITTDVTGISNIFDKKQKILITSAGNSILLAKKIKNLLTNKSEYTKISRAVFSKSQDFSWDKVAGKFINMWD